MNRIEILSGARKDLKKLDRKVSVNILKKVFPLLQENPGAGSELTGNLKGLWSYHYIYKGLQYWIIYEILPDKTIIILVAARENVYKKLRKRI